MQGGTREDAIDLTRDDAPRRDDARAAAIDDDGDVIFTRERRARAGARRRRARAWDEDEDANAARDRPRRRARRRAVRDDDDDDIDDDIDDGRRARRARARRRGQRRAVRDRDRDASDSDDAEWDAWDARAAAAAAADWNIVPFLDEMRAAAFNRFFHRDDGEPRDAPRGIARDVLEARAPATRAARDAPTCAVCLEDPSPRQLVRALPCAHCFHKKCIDRWFRASSVCPTCRANVGPPPRVDEDVDAVADRGRANALGVYLQVVQALGRRFAAVPRHRRR